MNLKYIFLVMAFTLATIASANADTACVVNSPDGELNVRDLTRNGPGRITDTLKNGYTVTMRDFYFLKGQSWARVVDGKTKTKVVGWVFKDYLDCNTQGSVRSAPPPNINAGLGPLPGLYVGNWCGGNGIKEEREELAFSSMNAGDHCSSKDGSWVLNIRKDGFTFAGEFCKFTSVLWTGDSWPRWTKPQKDDWVPEVIVTVNCPDQKLYSNKWLFQWGKGDQLLIKNF